MAQRHEEGAFAFESKKKTNLNPIRMDGMECNSGQCAKRCGIPFHWHNSIATSSQILLLGIYLIESSEKWISFVCFRHTRKNTNARNMSENSSNLFHLIHRNRKPVSYDRHMSSKPLCNWIANVQCSSHSTNRIWNM